MKYKLLNIYLYLLGKHLIPLMHGQQLTMPRKETRTKKKCIGAEGETLHHNLGNECTIGEEG